MTQKYGDFLIRPYEKRDFKEMLTLKIKKEDAQELYKHTGLTPREYFEWHLKEHAHTTNVIVYKDKIIGTLGVTRDIIDGNMLFFTTSKLDSFCKYIIVRRFKEILNGLLDSKGLTYCISITDNDYKIALKWATSQGFKPIEKTEEYTIIKYEREEG